MDARDIIKRPVITERSMADTAENKYTFMVDLRANKTEIKEAVQKLFKVDVERVNTMIVPGKWKRMGKSRGKTSDQKKAIVKIKEGQKIEIFEGA